MEEVKINQYEEAAREKKARSFADLLRAHGYTAADAERMDQDTWAAASSVLHKTPPSAATQKMVADLLRQPPAGAAV